MVYLGLESRIGLARNVSKFLGFLSQQIKSYLSAVGRLNSVTNGHFQESEFNASFPAMNLKSGRSTPDPNPPIETLQTGQSAKARF
jgi:hypothetical protein